MRPKYGTGEPTTRGFWARVGRLISHRPRAVWSVTAVLLAVASLGLIGFKVGTLTTAQSFRGHPESVTAETVLAQHFPAGAGEPVAVIGKAAAAPQLASALRGAGGIQVVSHPAVKDGLVFLQGTLASKPDSPAAYATIGKVRAAVHAVPGADAKVGGGTAVTMDVEHYATRDRNLIIPLVLFVVLVILALLLRAIVAPLVLIGTVVLSFTTALGLSALAFRHLFSFAGADVSMPLFAFVFLVALGIDYNIFLMTRVREEAKRSGTRQGALTGLAATGGVITSLKFHAPLGEFFATLLTNASTTDLWGSVVKCTMFGAIVAIVCCYKGMTASGGAEGVGRAVNQAVVIATTGVFAFNYVFTQTLLATHPEISVIK